jgi:iduronate 2-sulfatase
MNAFKRLIIFGGIFAGPIAMAEKQPPNVVVIFADDLNDFEGTYGHPLAKTPNMDRFAQQSLRFDRAYCQFPLCGPSRASFMTGLYPNQTGVIQLRADFRRKIPNAVTFSQFFEKQGYHTARVGKIYHCDNPGGIGTNKHDDEASWKERYNPVGIEKKFQDIRLLEIKDNKALWALEDDKKTGGRLSWLAADGRTPEGEDRSDPLLHTDGRVATKAIELIDQFNAKKKPFFLGVGFYKPHTPYIAPKQFFDLYDPSKIKVPDVPEGYFKTLPEEHLKLLKKNLPKGGLPDSMARETIHAYLATISFLDSQLGRVLHALDDPNGDGDLSDSLRENTIVLILSDHGYHMGEHGHFQKRTLFEEATRVPLLMRVPGMTTAGKATDALFELIDVYPTLTELAGFEVPDFVSGVSQAGLLGDVDAGVRKSVLSREEKGWTVRTDQYRYTRFKKGGPGNIELYDLQVDGAEMNNLAYSDPERYASTIREMDRLLQERLDQIK